MSKGEASKLLKLLSVLFLTFLVLRLVFLFLYVEELQFKSIAFALWNGLRFDAASLGFTFVIPILLTRLFWLQGVGKWLWARVLLSGTTVVK